MDPQCDRLGLVSSIGKPEFVWGSMVLRLAVQYPSARACVPLVHKFRASKALEPVVEWRSCKLATP